MAETKFVISVVDRATGPIKTINSHVKNMTGAFTAATKSILSFQTAFGFFTSGLLVRRFSEFSMGMLESADRFERMRMKFAAIGSPDFTKDVIAFARKNPVMEIKEIQDAYVKLYAVGINPTSNALQSLADASAAFGLTGPEVSRVLLAVQQIAGKGVVAMEELRGQMAERIASAIEIMATKLGYGQDRMRDFFQDVAQGKISARDGLTALFDGFQERYSGAAESMKNTWAGLMQGMKNEWQIMQAEIMTPEFFQTFKDAISDLMQTIKNHSEDIRTILKGIITLFRELIELAGELTNEKSTYRTGFGVLNVRLQQAALPFKLLGRLAGGGDRATEIERFGQEWKDLSESYDALFYNWAQNHRTVREMAAQNAATRAALSAKKLNVSAPFREGAASADTGYFMGRGPGAPGTMLGIESLFTVGQSAWRGISGNQALTNYMRNYANQQYLKNTAGDFYQTRPLFEGSFSENFKAELARMEDGFNQSFGNMARTGKESAKIVADAMAGAFNDFFVDAIEGRLQQFKDYLLSFFTSIGRAISQILSQYLALQALGYMMPGVFGGGAGAAGSMGPSTAGAGSGLPARMKAGASTPNVQIINNSGVPMTATAGYSANDMGDMVMTVVLDAVGRNKGGSRDALRGMLAT